MVLNLNPFSLAFGDEFIFEVTNIEIIENGNIYRGRDRGKVTTDNQTEIERKIIDKLNLNQSNAEDSQIQHYRVGNEFKAHWDYFDPKEDKKYLKNGQRTWTFMVYLNKVQKGGTTQFVNLNQIIYPKKGRAVVWCNIKKDGTPDQMTMHQSDPVIEGEKWIITKWFLQDKP